MKKAWWRTMLCLAVMGGCGGSNESNPPPADRAAPVLTPEGKVLPQSAPRRYPAYQWPSDFHLPLDIQIETESPPPEIVGPSKPAG